jgi:hypothetical protein
MAAAGFRAKVLVIASALVFGACGFGDDSGDSNDRDMGPGSFDNNLREICAQTADEEAGVLDVESESDLSENLEQVAKAHVELRDAFSELDPPPERESSFSAYLIELDEYVTAMERGYLDGEDPRIILESIVDQAQSGIALRDLADKAGLPDECPPLAGTNVHNTLFVAEANLSCFELGEDVLAGGPIELSNPPKPKEVSLVLDLGRRVTARIAGVIRNAETPGVQEIPVDALVRANRERFEAVNGLADALRSGDFDSYENASKRLAAVSRRADQLAMSVGLLHCARVFNLLPFYR